MAREVVNNKYDWINFLPRNWKVAKIGFFSEFYNGDRTSRYPQPSDFVDEGIPFITSFNINGDYIDTSHCKYITKEKYDSLSGAKIDINDIVFCLRGSVGKCALNDSLNNGTVASSLMAIRPKAIDPKYLLYCLLSDVSVHQTEEYMNGTCAANLSAENVSKYLIPVPSEIEQNRIAAFLDTECSHIDSVIEQTRTSIEEYKKLKQAVITQAVTKGIRHGRAMKDSGIEWIGEIPSEWNLQKIKNIASLITDGTHVTPNYIDSGVPFVSIKDISSGVIDFNDVKYISEEEHQVLSKSTPIEKGDMLFTRIGTLGVFVLVDTDTVFDIFVSVGLIKFKSFITETYKKFIRYFLLSNCTMNYINLVKAGGGTAAAKFNLTDVRNTTVAVPSHEEQLEIVSYLDNTTSKLDFLISTKQQLITELESYKKSLIYEYVTGKKEVPACQ